MTVYAILLIDRGRRLAHAIAPTPPALQDGPSEVTLDADASAK
jgi:hypothetical protein